MNKKELKELHRSVYEGTGISWWEDKDNYKRFKRGLPPKGVTHASTKRKGRKQKTARSNYNIRKDKDFAAWRKKLRKHLEGKVYGYRQMLANTKKLAPDESAMEVMYDYGYEAGLTPAAFMKEHKAEVKAHLPSKKRSKRPSPSVSATKFRVGTRRKGNDGKMWKVQATVKGVRRWVKTGTATKSKKKTIKLKKRTIPFTKPTKAEAAFRKEVARIGGKVPSVTWQGKKTGMKVALAMDSSPTRTKVPTTIADLDKTFARGKVRFILRSWQHGDEWKSYTRTRTSPKWKDVIKVFGDLLRKADDHHGFLEDITKKGNDYFFIMGS